MRYDQTLKTLFQSVPKRLLEILLGGPVEVVEVLIEEFPSVQSRRPDLVVRLKQGDVLHLEVQNYPDAAIAWRLLGYYAVLYEKYGRAPIQMLLWTGQGRCPLSGEIRQPALYFRYRVIDVARDIEADALLASDSLEDVLLALLCRIDEPRGVVRRILGRIAELPDNERRDALAKPLILSGLRDLEEVVNQEVAQMPIVLDIVID